MRLRLRIERNVLPPTQAVWPVKDAKCTIAQLLQQVNDIFPLEADTWGLEDYTVSVGEYECLHYHELEAVCREEDEVVIRPLQYSDIRARALAGRDQISADGRHLVDGVPFGRPCIKAPGRPGVRIPPRKKRRLLENRVDDQYADIAAQPLMLMEHGEDLDDEDEEEDDENFAVDEADVNEESEDDPTSNTSSCEDESEESDDSTSESRDVSSSESDSDSTSSSDSEESWNGIPTSAPPTPSKKQSGTITGRSKTSDLSPSSPGSKRKRESADEDQTTTNDHVTKTAKVDDSLPFQGKEGTKKRNARRRDAKKLQHLKATQVLPPDATLRTLYDWQEGNKDKKSKIVDDDTMAVEGAANENLSITSPGTTSLPQGSITVPMDTRLATTSTETLDHERSPDEATSKTLSKGAKKQQKAARTNAHVEEQRQELLTAIASGGIDVTEVKSGSKTESRSSKPAVQDDEEDEPPEELSTKQQAVVSASLAYADDANHREGAMAETATAMVPSAVARRSRLDLAGSKRLLFGSLGVRVPKTQEERDRLQKKLAERPKRNANAADQNETGLATDHPDAKAPELLDQAEADDPETWRDKIHLTAVECCEEGVKLSTPPFPFYQRWDPQQRKKKAGKRVNGTYMEGGGRKRKRGKQNSEYVETYDKYNSDGNGDFLNYDDAEDEDEYWEEGALLDGEDDDQAEEEDDGFPELPADLGTLPVLHEKEAEKGDFIAYTELACDESTEWQPKMVTRTAQVVEKPATTDDEPSPWFLQLSNRDLKPKKFDGEGNRVYSKFEMPGEDADDDDGRREALWTALGDAKLVLRPQPQEDGGLAAGDE